MARRIIRPFQVEVRNSGKRPKSMPAIAAPPAAPRDWPVEPEPAPPAATVPTGRVLLALDEPAPAVPRPKPQRRHRPETPDLAVESIRPDGEPEVPMIEQEDAEADSSAVPLAMDGPSDSPTIATTVLRQGRPRLPRDAFRREERWRTRLPTALHRVHGRKT